MLSVPALAAYTIGMLGFDFRQAHRYDATYAELVPEPRPVRTTVGSVLAPGVLIEIDVVACAGS
jgi:hypothetical protein